MSNQRWVTLATNDSYGLGALVLAHSLRRVGSAYPAVVLITPSVTEAMRERLRAVFEEVAIVDVLDSRDAAHLALLQRPELGITFTKIHCWNLTQYEKCVFLDADTLVIQNCDELFEREELSAAPDVGWPDCFNSGVFVFRPSAETFSNLITFASERGSFDGGDQGLLNSYFSDWAHGDIKKHLPFLYNVTSAAFYSYIPALKHFGQNLKIIHFIGAIKPWLQQYNWESRSVEAPEHLRSFLQLWWDLFVADVHTQLDTSMDNIEEESSPVLQEHIGAFREPVLHNAYYEPILDPDSEFPWHHPDNQIPDYEINVPEIDMSQFHDPWNIYSGNIPPSTEQSTPIEQTVDDYQDMRKYAWDYMPPQKEQYEVEISHKYEQTSPSNYSHVHQQIEPTQTYNTSHCSEQTQQQIHYSSFSSESHNIQQHSDQFYDHAKHFQGNSHHDKQIHKPYHFHEQQMSVLNNKEPQNLHEHHYTYNDRPEDDINLKVQNNESPINNHVSNTLKNIHSQEEVSIQHKKGRRFTSHSQLQNQNGVEQVYTVMMDHARMRCHKTPEATVNGYNSDNDSDVYEELTPRHPYDGFYLRHRMTIDSHGRKICIHEIPFVPRSPTPDSVEEFEDALENVSDDFNDETVIDEKVQVSSDFEINIQRTGVAGNLARVVPGAPLQREAVDELTRRQGWEAGNIDYMGADSFDNIWAKIFQTLNQQPATQPEQSVEPQQVNEPVAVEANMEVVEAVAEKQSVLPTSETDAVAPPTEKKETEVTATAESETPKVVESEVPKSTEPEVPKSADPEVSKPVESVASEPTAPVTVEVTTPTPKEPEQPELPVPATEVSEPSNKIEEPIPVPAEIAAEIPATVDVVVPVESSSPADLKEKSEQADIPIAALEALKIDEPVPEVPVTVTDTEQTPVSEPVPEVSTTPATVAVPAPLAPVEPVTATEPAAAPVEPATAPVEPVKATEPAAAPVEPATAPVESVTATEPAAAPVEPATAPVEPVTATEPAAAPVEPATAPVESAAAAAVEPALAPVVPASTPEAPAAKPEVGSDSPPLANTPSKEEIPAAPAAKSEERRKPAGKLQLRPPAVADPLPTPDSELEDAAALAHAIIASELRTPTVTAPSPPAAPPAQPAPAELSRLSVQEPEVPTPPVGSVSLTQIGVKPKPSTAAQIESSVSAKTEPSPKSPEATEAPKKKVVKKVLKKDKEGASSAEAPVPPPRKKEKKPKEK